MAIGQPWFCLTIPVFCLLVILPHSSQLPLSHHPHERVVEKSNEYVIGLIGSSQKDYETLVSSAIFEPISSEKLYGRTFYTGRIYGTPVVFVVSGPRRLNAGVAVHILMDTYKVSAIIQFGTVGSADSSLSYGDVSVPESLIYTGCWNWLKYKAPIGESKMPELRFEDFGYPENGENRLEGLQFKSEVVFTEEGMEKVSWVKTGIIYPVWASLLEDLKLEKCANTTCVPRTPKVIVGLKGSTSDIYVNNAAYRGFLAKKFKVSTIDQRSAAVVMAAMSGSVPVYVFQGVSDYAGGDTDYSSTMSSLPITNARNAAVEFIRIMPYRLQSKATAASL